jgi:hypothetical protein
VRISDSRRVVFVHVPKTGGISIEHVLDQIEDSHDPQPTQRHIDLTAILRRHKRARDYWTFGFVRNPWARMVSWWSMIHDARDLAAQGDAESQRLLAAHGMWRAVLEYRDFATFIDRGPREWKRMGKTQVSWLTTPRGRRVDFVGRTETFTDDLRAVAARLGLPPPVAEPRHNASVHGHYRDYYTPQTRHQVAHVFRADIRAFGYRF